MPKINSESIRIKGRIKLIMKDVITGEIDDSGWIQNLITTAGKAALLRRMGNRGVLSNEGMVTYGAVGNGASVVPAIGDTILSSELARKVLSYSTVVGLVLTLRVYYNTSEANGTLTEFGWFGEAATASANTGTLFNHCNISKTKTPSKTLTVVQEFTFA